MNFVGHVEVARLHRVGPDGGGTEPEVGFLVGAALPDLAAIGRFRILERPTDPVVAAGIDLHHRTDDLFHGHPWFRTNCAALTARLDEFGLSRGAARACGHVGVELLLDGRLLTERTELRPSVQGMIQAAGDGASEFGRLVDAERRTAWRAHLEQLAQWAVPADYHQPEAVATRLQRILTHRPRLSFPVGQVASVATALAERQATIEGGADLLVEDLARRLAPSN